MITLAYGSCFLKSSRKLPKVQQKKLAKLLEIVQDNPFHSRLHAKPLSGQLSGFYSFRITRDWRVIFQFLSPDKIQLVEVGHKRDIYR